MNKYRYLAKDNTHQLNGMVKSFGFSLLEVLISMVVLSIGLLGIAGLQATSKRTSYEALQRTTAVMLTRDIIERMRTNPDQIAAYSGTVNENTAIAHNDCSAATCTPVQLAAYDLFEWQQAILGANELSDTGVNTGGLVSPVGCITVAAACTSCSVTVAIAWRGMTKLSDPTVDTCGNASGNYDDTAGDNVFRRVIAINSFITNN